MPSSTRKIWKWYDFKGGKNIFMELFHHAFLKELITQQM